MPNHSLPRTVADPRKGKTGSSRALLTPFVGQAEPGQLGVRMGWSPGRVACPCFLAGTPHSAEFIPSSVEGLRGASRSSRPLGGTAGVDPVFHQTVPLPTLCEALP
jgi:hypothetical protein